jgi:autotransporter family porin
LNKVVNNAPLATTGDSSDGIEAKTTNSGPISVTNNAQIDTVGSTATDGSKGIMATSDTGIIEVTNTGKIATTGPADAAGIKAVTGGDGTITVTNSAPLIETKGDSSDGIVATSDSGTTITNNGPVTTHGADSEAIDSTTAAGNNTVTNTSTLTTLGDNSDGIVTVSTSGKIDVANSGDVTTTGVGSNGIEATTAIGAVKIDNSAAVTSEQAVGVLATATGAAGAFELDNQTTGSISGGTAGVAISGDFATAQINNAGIIGAANDLAIDSTKLGPAGLTIDNSGTITGVVTLGNGVNTMDNAGTWNLQNYSSTATATPGVAVADFGNSGQNVINNSGTINLIGAPGVAADPASVYVPLKDGTVVNAQVSNQYNAPAPAGPVQGQIMGVQTFNSNPGGVIDLTDGGKYTVPGNVLVISGGHTAGVDGGGVFVANGGSLVVNTVLNDAGANSRSDVLVVDSTQLGQAGPDLITVKPVPGFAGAPTLGNNGIPVVEVLNKDASASPDGVFKLNSPAVSGSGVPYVSGGLYGYALMHNGTGADVTDGNWYLRSDLCDINPDSEMCMVPHGKEPLPESPYYRLADSVYTALPSLALQYGHDLLDTLHERVGEEEDIRGRADLNTWTPKTGAWARVFDTHGTQNGDAGGILYGGSPEYDYDFFGLQVGQDLYRKEHDGGSRDHAGLYFAYGHADSDVTHYDGLHGRNQFGAYSLGGYWTHFGQSGWYTDAVLQGTYYDATSTADRDVPDMTTHGNGFAASLEAGKPFRFGHGYFIEPQAQLTYQTIDFADTNDTRANVSFSDVDSLTGRIGARLGHDWTLSRERQMTVWVRPNLWHEFRGDTATTVSAADGTASFHSDLGGTWGELNLGISGQVTPLSSTRCTSSLYANVSYDRSFDGDGQAWVGKVGIRFSW